MAKREKKAPEGPNMGYLISFGDTMTALLAFFIVMNSLAKEQTGANIHAGTGSFIQATDGGGMPGMFSKDFSRQAMQLQDDSPLYIVPSDDPDAEPDGSTGPDEDADNSFIRDREQEDYERFLIELERLHEMKPEPVVSGEVSFDRMTKFPEEGSLFDRETREMVVPLSPQMHRKDYEVELVVWSPTPSASAWKRTTLQSNQWRQEIIKALGLSELDARRVTASAKPWMYSDVKRPVATIVVRKLTL